MFTKLKYAFNYIWSGKDEDLDKLIGVEGTRDAAIFDSSDYRVTPPIRGFLLLDAEGNEVGTYTRRRDAVRGANRRGLKLAA